MIWCGYEQLMKEDIYRVVVTSYSPNLKFASSNPGKGGFVFLVHILFPVLYFIFPLYRLSEAFLGLKYILQKCLEFDSTGCVQVSLNSMGSTRRSHFPGARSFMSVVDCCALYSNGSGLRAPSHGRTGLDWQYGRPSRTTWRAEL